MKLTGAEIIIRLLEKIGVKIVAGIPGGSNLPLYDALYHSNIRHILARHEQGAGFIAHGMARSTGKTAVCFATSGPGSTNLVTAIADAKMDSVPIVAVTGQVPSSMIGTDAFQEVDTYGLTLPITKHNFLVRSAEDLVKIIPDAFRIANSGRPGPVIIDIPKDVQQESVDYSISEYKPGKTKIGIDYSKCVSDNNQQAIYAAEIINKSKKPVIISGGGVIISGAGELLTELSRRNSIPVASTLMGLGSFPPDNPLFLGMLGMHGERYTNLILNESDLLIVLGARFDDRATGNINKFCKGAAVLHIDIDPSEINKIKKADFSIVGDIDHELRQLLPLIENNSRKEWMSGINKIIRNNPKPCDLKSNSINPSEIIKNICSIACHDSIIATDVGQHQMWTAQTYQFSKPRTFLTSGGLGTMGFGLPVSIGAALANPGKTVICISGDGSILMNIQELATMSELQLNIKIFILNNGHLGLVRQQQELFYKSNYIASKFIREPDFKKIGLAFGIDSFDLEDPGNTTSILTYALLSNGPCLINVKIPGNLNVKPIVPPGAANTEMIEEKVLN